MKEVQLYTDGACRGNPGKGGWGAVLVYGRHEKVMSGGERETTNNRMELTAAIEGLSALKEPCSVKLYSDSKYLVDGFTQGWVYGWEQKSWSKVKNPDLWEELLRLSRLHRIEFIWVKGHNGHEYNERCDKLACDFADSFKD